MAPGSSSRVRNASRRVHLMNKNIPEFVARAANLFASQVTMPVGAGANSPMRDLKGWLASLVNIEVLPRWVEAAGILCFSLSNAQDLQYRAETFTKAVLRQVLDRDPVRSQSIDTTLRRQCCMEPGKSGLTFMKILIAVCAAYDFAGSTSRCYRGPYLGINSGTASLWLMRFEYLVSTLRTVRLCVKNDAASRELVNHITGPYWGRTLATLLLNDHHSVCWGEPAVLFAEPCASRENGVEMEVLCYAISKAVTDAAPYTSILRPQIVHGHFSHTRENDPLCCAAMMMPFNPAVAVALVDKVIGLDKSTFSTGGMPLEIHREIRIYHLAKRLMKSNEALSDLMTQFSKVFKFNKPPLLWWPNSHEIDLITQQAANSNAVAITVWGLMIEHMAETGLADYGSHKVRALQMFKKAGDNGDLFGVTHAAKIYMEGGDGVQRDPKKAEVFLWQAVKRSNIRVAMSLLGDLYNGRGEPQLPKDQGKAAKLYEAAADLGCFRAAYRLANMYETGIGGLSQDVQRAERLREFAKDKEMKKKEQYRNKLPVDPNTPVPDPNYLLCLSENQASGLDLLSHATLEYNNMFAEYGEYVEGAPNRRRVRDDAEIGIEEFVVPEGGMEIPIDHPMPSNYSTKRRRTGFDTVLEIRR